MIAVVVDKFSHNKAHHRTMRDAYHYAFTVLLERYSSLLGWRQARGDVLVESRNAVQDKQLNEVFESLFTRGTKYHPAGRFETRFTSKQLKLKKKADNIAGLQLADMLAHPISRWGLNVLKRIETPSSPFVDRLRAAVRSKFHVDPEHGTILGRGFKFLD